MYLLSPDRDRNLSISMFTGVEAALELIDIVKTIPAVNNSNAAVMDIIYLILLFRFMLASPP